MLRPLFAPLGELAGVAPRTAGPLGRLVGPRVVDLLWHLPVGVVDARYAPTLAEAVPGRVATVAVTVGAHRAPPGGRAPYRIACRDATGSLTLVFFRGRAPYLRELLPEGGKRVVAGTVERRGGELQMVHPHRIGTVDEFDDIRTVEPVYRRAAGIGAAALGRAVTAALETAPDLPEWHDAAWKARRRWPGWLEAVRAAHAPDGEGDLAPSAPARERLAYDELLAGQIALARSRERSRPGRATCGDGRLRARLDLPFALTASQDRAIAEIVADMASERRMLRLLQGDVGSGKTVVSAIAMLAAVEAGAQAALLVPTDLLARQHHATMSALFGPLGVSVGLLAPRGGGAAATRDAIAAGGIDVAVGTHAIFQERVRFRDLALAVVDEQQRFGVHQRLALAGKGVAPDLLAVTATPIPRTLLMTVYGDLRTSRLTERPAGRKPVATRVVPLARVGEVVARLARAVAGGARAYWVCPLVEASETSDLAAATGRHAALAEAVGAGVGLLHGRLDGDARAAVLADFAAGRISVLVTTAVIEVGIDVPEATIMVIEHAERFGLAQLHQMRGRVGRGAAPSSCILLHGAAPGGAAGARLRVLRDTDDGFAIAEQDLRLRGAGEILGSRQSGLPRFRLADPAAHGDLLRAARDDARLVVDRDPGLDSGRGRALRLLLALFGQDGGGTVPA